MGEGMAGTATRYTTEGGAKKALRQHEDHHAWAVRRGLDAPRVPPSARIVPELQILGAW